MSAFTTNAFSENNILGTLLNQIPWYLEGGISAADVVGAYVAKGAGSKNLSFRNIANPGTNDLVETGGITWDAVNGWSGFSATKYLTGASYKSNTYSILVLYSGATTDNTYGRAVSNEASNGTTGMFLIPNSAGADGYFMQGNVGLAFAKKASGVSGASQTNVFNDGVDAGSIIPSGSEITVALRIGTSAFAGSTARYFRGKIQAVVVYNKSITNAQMIAVSQKLLTDSFIADSFRDFSTLTRYAGNPIITHNTEAWNVLGVDTPYISVENKIGNTWYALTQVSNAADIWNDLALYKSDDLVTWTAHSTNPVISKTLGAWDAKYLLHPCIIKVGNTYRAYYSASNGANKHQIGFAESTDLITWTKYASNPVFSTATNASVPWVVLIDSTYFMYYWNRVDGLYYATSTDGITWVDKGAITLPLIVGDWDYGYARLDPCVNKLSNGWYELTYTAYLGGASITQKIGYAVSKNGINWYKYDAPILVAGTEEWENGYVGDPVLIDNPLTGKGNLFYVGVDNNNIPVNSASDAGLAIID